MNMHRIAFFLISLSSTRSLLEEQSDVLLNLFLSPSYTLFLSHVFVQLKLQQCRHGLLEINR